MLFHSSYHPPKLYRDLNLPVDPAYVLFDHEKTLWQLLSFRFLAGSFLKYLKLQIDLCGLGYG